MPSSRACTALTRPRRSPSAEAQGLDASRLRLLRQGGAARAHAAMRAPQIKREKKYGRVSLPTPTATVVLQYCIRVVLLSCTVFIMYKPNEGMNISQLSRVTHTDPRDIRYDAYAYCTATGYWIASYNAATNFIREQQPQITTCVQLLNKLEGCLERARERVRHVGHKRARGTREIGRFNLGRLKRAHQQGVVEAAPGGRKAASQAARPGDCALLLLPPFCAAGGEAAYRP